MSQYHLVVPCHFGVESVLKREIIRLGYEITKIEDGKITFLGDERAISRANIFLRTAERVLLQVARIQATTYDELFEAVKALDWKQYIPQNGRFWVTKASTIKSKLFSSPDIQRIVKKAIVEKLKREYRISWFPEDGNDYPLRVIFFKDEAIIALDTTGEPLHKRGYRKLVAKAPISETLAAALLLLTPWKKDRILVDPFCGCGTIPIEAAMMAANIAPGMNREFTAEKWTNIMDKKFWYDTVNEANDLIDDKVSVDIQGYDIDDKMVQYARKNAKDAFVEHMINFRCAPIEHLTHPGKYGFIISNPPYGERLEDKKSLQGIYTQLGERYRCLDRWSAFIISAYDSIEKDMGIKANKNRKIYNGMLKTYLYQFMGPKPEKVRNGFDTE